MATKDYLSRPKTKPAETLRGKLNKWDNGYAEFIPAGTRESNRRMLKQMGNSSFYKSEGEKESSYSLHLNVDGKCEDPVAAMYEQFMQLTEGERKQLPQLPQLWLDSGRGEVVILARLACSAMIDRQLLQAQSQMNVTIGRHRTEIINTLNK